MSDPLRIAELVCARLCHDLSGPVGSLVGSTEILCETPALAEELAEEAVALVGEAASELGKRLVMLRAAWTTSTSEMGPAQIGALVAGLPGARRLKMDVSGLDQTELYPPALARVLINVLMLAAEGLPRGGTVALTGSRGRGVAAVIAGEQAAWPAGFAASLVDPMPVLLRLENARELQAPLTVLIARAAKVKLSLMMAGSTPDKGAPPLFIFFPED